MKSPPELDPLEAVYAQFPGLSTPRLRLRETRPDDAPAVFEFLSRPEVTRFYDISTLTRLEEAEAIVARRARDFAQRTRIRWAIARREDDRVIGSCGFGHWHVEDAHAEIGYELSPDYQGRGLMREALTAMLDFGFGTMRLHRVQAHVVPENAPSRRLLARLGFQEEGLRPREGYWKGAYHDLIRLSLFAEPWERLKDT